jgi:hypothetical protein
MMPQSQTELGETLSKTIKEQNSSKVRSNSIGAALSSLVKRGTSPWKSKTFSTDSIALAIEEQQQKDKFRPNSLDSPNPYTSPISTKHTGSAKRTLSRTRLEPTGTRTTKLPPNFLGQQVANLEYGGGGSHRGAGAVFAMAAFPTMAPQQQAVPSADAEAVQDNMAQQASAATKTRRRFTEKSTPRTDKSTVGSTKHGEIHSRVNIMRECLISNGPKRAFRSKEIDLEILTIS